jgi:tetratricopeptide (TPR) repeat protein
MSRFDPRSLLVAALSRCGWVALGLICLVSFAAEPGPPSGPTGRADETNAQDTLRSLLQVQEQLHATQLAIERNRQETDAAAARSAEALGTRLQGIEQALAAQRAQELETMQSSNKVMLIVAGSFAGLGFVALLLTAYFQWRIVSRLAEISASLPFGHALGAGPALGSLGADDTHHLALGPAQESNQRLLGALDRLEKRIHDLEHTSRLPLKEGEPLPQAGALPASDSSSEPATEGGADAARITVLLGKGQSLLNLDHAEEALSCFDEVLALDANHPEALVKKGAALERLRKLDEAVACYDRAIAADSTLTVAYLYKGGLFNRMERFSEALECYEKALRTQETRRG